MAENVDNQDITGLFSYPELKELYLIKKYKEVDFFIKQNCFYSSEKLIKTLKKVKGISLVYRIYDFDENLNFYGWRKLKKLK